ncbi:MAG: GNAT family N-acetyltransferase [Candidatus Hatepunaea meridiana]|nr:GNAT family N-acetyltransferase [Candidatus Hatepunaea meridiana]
MKIIETERLILRKMTIEDVNDMLVIFSDPLVMKSFEGIIFNRKQMEGWVKGNLAHHEKYGYGSFSVILKTHSLLIGDLGLEVMEVDGRTEVEIGYDFRSDYWNRGLATEAASAVRDYAFSELGLDRVISLIKPDNVPSRRVAEKIGMVREKEILRSDMVYWVYALSRDKT